MPNRLEEMPPSPPGRRAVELVDWLRAHQGYMYTFVAGIFFASGLASCSGTFL